MSIAVANARRRATASGEPATRSLPGMPAIGRKRSSASARSATTSALLDLVLELSSRFANVVPEKTDREIRAAMRRVLDLFELDRCTLYEFSARTGTFDVVQRVNRARTAGVLDISKAADRFPWLFDQVIRHGKVMSFKSLDELPPHAEKDKQSLRASGIHSLLLIPAVMAHTVDHVVTFASTRAPHAWSAAQMRGLRLLGETFVGALRTKAHHVARAEARRFEQLIFDLSSGFAGVPWDRIDDQIDASLKQLLAFTAADQCGFFTVFPERGEACLSYLAAHEVTVPVGTTTQYETVTPWLYQRVVKRMELTFFTRRDELPPEASVDIKYLEGRTQAALYIPYPVDGTTRYLLAVVTNSAERQWPAHVVERLKVLGGIFVSALNRKAVVGAQMGAQDRLGAAERFARATLDALNEYVGVVDTQGELVESSDHWHSLGMDNDGSPEGVPVGGNYLAACESVAGPRREAAVRLAAGVRSVLAADVDSFTIESSLPLQNGPRWMQSQVRRFVVDQNVYAAISHEDVTARRKSEQELQDLRAQQWHSERITRMGVLVASLAHELSQPLTAILSNAQAGLRFIAGNGLEPQEMRAILSDIIFDERRAADIIESLRIMLRRQETGRRLVGVAEIVRDVVKLLHSEFIRRQVDVEQACAEECVVLANRAQIQQVVLNLVMNAVEAMLPVAAERRRMRLTAERTDEGKVRIRVRDSGVGIVREDLERAFNGFWTTKSRGTGMGLSICHSIIESHGGRIWGERNDDHGSTFFVELPAASTQAAAATHSAGTLAESP